MQHYDIVIIGAGISGAVLAERYAKLGKKVLVIEKRDHIAGNCYDYHDEHGVLVSKYGAHLFHTNFEDGYFSDKYQAQPEGGFTKMFEKMLSSPNITVRRFVADFREAMYEAWDMVSGRVRPELGGQPDYLDFVGLNYYIHNQEEVSIRFEHLKDDPQVGER